MRRKIHNPDSGKLRLVGYISGSGNTLWKIHELQKQLDATFEGSPFEVTGCFSSDPSAKGVETARTLGIPVESIDLRAFYRERNSKFSDMDLRREYDQEALKLIKRMEADLIVLAGYVWATTDVLLDRYTFLNVHPADLSVMEEGRRLFAGANGVGDALEAGAVNLHASSHLATSELDGGPILCISPAVPVDYSLKETLDEKEFMRAHLKQVNAQSRMTGARTVYEIACGNFELDERGKVWYLGEPAHQGIRIESWEQEIPLYERDTAALLRPRSVAVIGASAKGGIGYSVVSSLLASGFTGEVSAVNLKGETVAGVEGFGSILDIPGDVDMAVVTVPSRFVLSVAEECGRKGVKALVCISAGFRETGGEGAAAEKKLMEIVNRYNMRMLGPNCMGLSNNDPAVKLNTTILHDLPARGNIAFVTQSGGLGAVLLDYAERLGIGFSVIASLGNQADVNANDLLPLIAEDEETEVVLLYLETIPQHDRFRRILSRLTARKPVILLKAGRTEAGARAASSHTGSLAGDDQVVESLIESCGIIRAESVYSAFFIAAALSRIPRPAGRRVAVVTNGGGPGILLSDALSRAGLEVPPLPDAVQESLRKVLLPEAAVSNPIDLVAPAPPGHYAEALRQVISCGMYDAVALLCIPPATITTAEVAEGVVEGLRGMKEDLRRIPLLSCFFGPGLGEGGRRVLAEAGFPTVEYPEQLAEVLAASLQKKSYAYRLAGKSTLSLLREAHKLLVPDRNAYLPQKQAWDLLKLYGFHIAEPVLAISAQDLDSIAPDYPVVLKIDHPDLVHKSDEGGVILGVEGREAAAAGIDSLLSRFPGARGVLVQPQIESGLEVILGCVRDESAGHAVMVGLGGVLVELLKDVAFLHVPFTREEAKDALFSLKSAPLLTAYRGSRGVNVDSLLDQMMNIGKLVSDFSGIAEIDLNPLMFSAKDDQFTVADCRVLLHT